MNSPTTKVALITGASRGIGAATAIEFARNDIAVLLAARSTGESENVVREIQREGGEAEFCPCDVANPEDVKNAIEQCQRRFGQLDILVNNAGVIEPIASIADADPQQWSQSIDVNLKGVFYAMHTALPIMAAQQQGIIVNVSSGAAHHPLEGWSHYCAAKAGVAMLTESAHLEYAASGVRIVGISPGTVATRMQVVIKASGVNPVSQLDPTVHIDASWPARAIAWLCTDDAAEFAGQEVSLREDSIRKRVGLI